MKTCPSCERNYEDDVDICEDCGAFLIKKGEETAPPAEVQQTQTEPEETAPPNEQEGEENREGTSDEESGSGKREEADSSSVEESEQPAVEQPVQGEGTSEPESVEGIDQSGQPAGEPAIVTEPTVATEAQLEEGKIKCASCGWEGKTDDEYCPECGSKLGERPSAPEPPKPSLARLLLPDSSEINLDAFPYQFGRRQMTSYPESDTVSSNHFRITSSESGGTRSYEIEDTNSLNGTSLNGNVIGYDRKSNGKFSLKDGDKISLSIDPKTGTGKFDLTFRVIEDQERI